MPKKLLYITLCLLIWATSANAQANCSSPRERQEHFKQIQSAKVAFFTAQLQLSTEEAEKFWPVYNKYWEIKSKEHESGTSIFKRICNATSGTMSDVEMKSLMLEWQNHKKKENDIENLYLEEFYKILPVKKVLQIYVAEEQFRRKMIDMWKRPHQNNGDND